MSGLFKNFDKIISASQLSTPNHRFIVKNCLYNFTPAINYFVPNEKLDRGHSRDVFELSLLSYQLQKQNQTNQTMLENLSQDDHAKLYNEISQKLQNNQEYITDAINEINLQLNVGINETPVSALTSLTYILGQQQHKQASTIFNTHIKSQLLEKIEYTSQQDLIDLVSGLKNIGISDKAVWSKVLNRLQNKVFDWQLNEVKLHAWETTTYESSETSTCSFFNRQSHTERYYNDVVSGNTGLPAEIKRNVYRAFDELYFRVINPLFFRNSRGTEFFYQLDADAEKESLLENLKAVSAQVPEAAQTATVISNRG